jgi:hypothetical protein
MGTDRKYRVPKIVSSNESSPSWLRITLLLLIVSAAGWYGYQLGGADLPGGFVGFNLRAEKKIGALQQEREELSRQVAMLQQSAQLDQEAMRAIKEQIKLFQDERLKMEEELAFLRGIVSTSPKERGLRIQKYKLEPDYEKNSFTYKFTVSQVINSGLMAKGKILISLSGLQAGQAKVLGLELLTDKKQRSHKMRFRYFQNIEGKLKLPDGFTPSTLTIEVKPESKKMEPITATYDWSPLD